MLSEQYDSGHPIKIDSVELERRLADGYEPMLRRLEKFERTKYGLNLDYEILSFVGWKIRPAQD